MATRTTTGHWVVWLVIDGFETDDIQRDVWFFGTDRHELKKEISVVSNQMRQEMLGGATRVKLT